MTLKFTNDEKLAVDILMKEIPDLLEGKSVKFNHSGWTTMVVEVDETWIIKFPRNQAVYEQLKKEKSKLDAIKDYIDFDIPDRQHILGDYPFFIHRKLEGEHFGYVEFSKASDEQKNNFISSVASVFAQLHAIPIDEVVFSNMKHNLPEDHEMMDVLNRSFNPAQVSVALDYLQKFRNLDVAESYQRTGLFDFHGFNIVVDPETKKIKGIFDFDELAVGDYYFNLREIALHYSPNVMKEVCEKYEQITQEKINQDRLDLCFRGWYIFEYVRLIKNQDKLTGVFNVNSSRHRDKIADLLTPDGIKPTNPAPDFKP